MNHSPFAMQLRWICDREEKDRWIDRRSIPSTQRSGSICAPGTVYRSLLPFIVRCFLATGFLHISSFLVFSRFSYHTSVSKIFNSFLLLEFFFEKCRRLTRGVRSHLYLTTGILANQRQLTNRTSLMDLHNVLLVRMFIDRGILLRRRSLYLSRVRNELRYMYK